MMKDSDLKRNGSGYIDEPCYKACTAPPKAGEIWRYSMNGDDMLVLGGNDKVCSCLKLLKFPADTSMLIPVTVGHEVLYTDPVMIGYAHTWKLETYVTKLHPETLAAVLKAVGKHLGIPAADTHELEEQVQSLTDENDGLKQSYKDIFSANEKLRLELKAMHALEKEWNDSAASLNQQLTCMTIYKDMYMDLIDKLVCARGGAVIDKTGIQ